MKHFLELTIVNKVGIQVSRSPCLLRTDTILRVERVSEENPNYTDGANTAVMSQFAGQTGWSFFAEPYEAVTEQLRQQVSDGEWK